jgi:uncharacterized protein (TIGR02145 family)
MESGAKAADGAKSTETGDGAKFTDSRDGKTYKTVKIGTAVWMAENLNFAADGSKCYENNDANCAKYGRLYDWATAMKACPAGYRLPSDDEWTALENALGGGPFYARTKLTSADAWPDGCEACTNESGFSALPGGDGGSGGDFNSLDDYGYWWSATESATESDANCAVTRLIYYYSDGFTVEMDRRDYNKTSLFSVRCVAN